MEEWRNGEQYKLIEKAGPDRIRHECLRRHPEYRRDWATHHDPAFPIFASFQGIVEKYGADLLINPALSSPPLSSDQSLCIPASLERQGEHWTVSQATAHFALRAAHEKAFLARIDPTAPLAPQWEHIQNEIAAWQKELALQTKTDDKRFRRVGLYLQVLDAKEAQAGSGPVRSAARITNDEIAEVLNRTWGEEYQDRIPELVRRAKEKVVTITGLPWPEGAR